MTPPAHGLTRRRLLAAASGSVLASLAAPALALGRNQVLITMINAHVEERFSGVLKSNGRIIADELDEFSRFARDWREDAVRRISPTTADILIDIHERTGVSRPFTLICGYRTPKTNAMLRARSQGVARHSLHMDARALDISHPDLTTSQLHRVALSIARGGVGKYSRSRFVHIDDGPVRSWGS